jgi:hypothetical protein
VPQNCQNEQVGEGVLLEALQGVGFPIQIETPTLLLVYYIYDGKLMRSPIFIVPTS